MLLLRSLAVLSVAIVGLLAPAQAQNPLAFPAPIANASTYKIAYLLDPAHNPAPEEDFAMWPGLPSPGDLGPQAASLFEAAPNSSYRLPNGVLAVTPTKGNEDRSLTVWIPSTPNVNVGPGTPIGSVLSLIKWFDQPNESTSVSATLWRFTDDIPEPFAQLLKDWDGKSPLIEAVDREEIQNMVITGNYIKNTDKARYRLQTGVPLDMQFRSNLVAKQKDPVPPQDHVRVTMARFLRDGGVGMEAESELSFLFDSPGKFWEPVTVTGFSPSSELVVLLPEDHETDGVKATFLQLHVSVPGMG